MAKSNSALKSAIHKASETLHARVEKTEAVAVAATDQVGEMLGKAQAGFEQVKVIGETVATAATDASRAVWNSTKEINATLAQHGKAAFDDMVHVGQKSFEVKSVQEFVALHTEYAARRITANFEAANAVNGLAHANAIAMLAPITGAMRTGAHAADGAMPKAAVKSVAKVARGRG